MQLNQELCSLLKGKQKLKHSRLADDPDKKNSFASHGVQWASNDSVSKLLVSPMNNTDCGSPGVLIWFRGKKRTGFYINPDQFHSLRQIRKQNLKKKKSGTESMLWCLQTFCNSSGGINTEEVFNVFMWGEKNDSSRCLAQSLNEEAGVLLAFEGKSLYKCLNSLSNLAVLFETVRKFL